MFDQYCDRCGEYLPEGSIKYTVHIQILSDFDGVILLEGEDIAEEAQKIFGQVENMAERELEEEIFQELSFVLCGNCKREFARDPFNRGTGLFKKTRGVERLFH